MPPNPSTHPQTPRGRSKHPTSQDRFSKNSSKLERGRWVFGFGLFVCLFGCLFVFEMGGGGEMEKLEVRETLWRPAIRPVTPKSELEVGAVAREELLERSTTTSREAAGEAPLSCRGVVRIVAVVVPLAQLYVLTGTNINV